MKKLINAILTIVLFTSALFAQNPFSLNCGTEGNIQQSSFFQTGRFKPVKTLPTNDSLKYLRILVVFVEFNNDYSESGSTVWQPMQLPTYADEMFAVTKAFGIDGYSETTAQISDYWNRISRDQFDVIADVYHVILPNEYSYYNNQQNKFQETHLDVYRMLDTNLYIDWSRYDLWSWSGTEFIQSPDGYVDMMIIQHRHKDIFGTNYGGFAGTSANYTAITNPNVQIDGGFWSYTGSGVTQLNGYAIPDYAFFGLFVHEYSHFTLGDHRPYSKVAGQDGTRTAFGYEFALSPQDMISIGYDILQKADFSQTSSYTIGDMITTGDILKVPISTQDSSEYFLIGNRRRLTKYDSNMGGDTAMGLPLAPKGEYGKGVYIYHVTDGNNYDAWVDLECADGLFNWEYSYLTTPFWSDEQQLPFVIKNNIKYDEDNPLTDMRDATRLICRDGMSMTTQNSEGEWYHTKWFGYGNRHTSIGEQGMDRIFTNNENAWCSVECLGDRWDPWNINYNQIFSPYSSPSTKNRNNDSTGIFIYYDSLANNSAKLKIYKAGSGGLTEEDILELTPPSKPILYRPVTIVSCYGTYGYPKITWDNNKEPDMVRNNGSARYFIYRAHSTDAGVAPWQYNYVATYTDFTPTDTANFIDNGYFNGVRLWCSEEYTPPEEYNVRYRYKIVAVDKYEDQSVMSDFVTAKGRSNLEDHLKNVNTDKPTIFSLQQNYPNPFNPSTQIKYALPVNGLVKIAIYDLLGREVQVIVNEYKDAGYYEIRFDGTNFASGIYFYRIEAGNFIQSKKMLLIK